MKHTFKITTYTSALKISATDYHEVDQETAYRIAKRTSEQYGISHVWVESIYASDGDKLCFQYGRLIKRYTKRNCLQNFDYGKGLKQPENNREHYYQQTLHKS